MSVSKKVLFIATSVALTLSLTACDPPMPLSLQISQAELQVQCEEGEVTLGNPAALADLALSWSDAASIACEQMIIIPSEMAASDIQITEQSLVAPECKPFLTVPIAVDAAVFVTNIPDYFEIYLSPEQLALIFDGTVTNWADPQLLANNEEYPLPDLPIILPTSATASSKKALSDWFSRLLGYPFDLSFIEDSVEISEIELATPIEEGAISISSVSAATYVGSSIVAIVTESGNPESVLRPDYESLLSAKSQLVSSFDNSILNLELNPNIEPQAEEGLAEAVPPYQGIYPLKMALCGGDSILKRTVGRYFLRQDSQGIVATSALMPLPESIRIEAIELVSVGLPTPSASPTEQ